MTVDARVGNAVPLGFAIISAFLSLQANAANVFQMPQAQTSLQFVTIRDPGNTADTTGFGAVGYLYNMGKFDVTVAQYAEFLNAVAKTDPYSLYNSTTGGGSGAYEITRAENVGGYIYDEVSGTENLPVNYITWGDAARFANWLSNGQPTTGIEAAGTTETGSYALNGAVTDAALMLVNRSASADYVIPTENEWYKAAYYKSGSTTAGYWLYPTQSNADPSNVLSSTDSNSANFYNDAYTDPTNYFTPVGAFADSPSAYGTYDQGGNIRQWNEAVITDESGSYRQLRGGSYGSLNYDLCSSYYDLGTPSSYVYNTNGFRVAQIPEPSSVTILAFVGILVLRKRKIKTGKTSRLWQAKPS